VFWCNRHKGYPEDRVGSGGENLEFEIFISDFENDVTPFASTDPVALDNFHILLPTIKPF
jgi:hypothetical protein